MFKNRLIIITGGSSGLGKALAHRLLKKGASIALIARDGQKLSAVKAELAKASGASQKIGAYSCDVSDFAAVEKTMTAIVNELGLPYMLINSAGVLYEGYFEKMPLSVFRRLMDINYFGTLHCIRAVLPFFKKSGKGRIVNISSLAGLIGTFGYSAYCSSKFAVNGLTEALRVELKPQKIRFHLVCPGEFESPMVDELNSYRSEENRLMTQTVPVLDLDTVADETIRGIEKGRYLIVPGRIPRLLEFCNRTLPRLGRSIQDYKLKKIYRGPNRE